MQGIGRGIHSDREQDLAQGFLDHSTPPVVVRVVVACSSLRDRARGGPGNDLPSQVTVSQSQMDSFKGRESVQILLPRVQQS